MTRNNFCKTKFFPRITLLTTTALVVSIAIAQAVFCAPAAEERAANNLIILFTHDLHSNLEEYNVPASNNTVASRGGYARLSAAVNNERLGREKNVLLLDAGDFSMGTLFHVVRFESSPELRIMGIIGYDATTFGNHDFEYGPNQLAAALLAAKKYNKEELPAIVASNTIADPRIKALDYFRKAYAEYPVLPYKVVKRAGLRIGLFGLMGKDAASYVPEARPVEFSDPIDAARKTVDVLRNREKVDMVICLSHCGIWRDKDISEDEILASEVPGIDVIISGHTHTVLNPYIYIGKTCIVSSGAYGRYLGRLELAKDSGLNFKVADYRLILITSKFTKDQKIFRLIDSFKKEINRDYLKAFHYSYGQALAYLPFSLTDFNWGAGERSKLVTSGLGDLVTDAFIYAVKKTEGKDYRKISLAFEGFGQIRVPLAKGILTVDDTFRLMSLGLGPDGKAGSPLVAFWLTGKEIKSFLELETTLAPKSEDMHLQISGVRFSYDPNAPEFRRIKTIEVQTAHGRFKSLEENSLYRVCTNWKIILMGDNLKTLSNGKIEFVPKDVSGNPIVDMRETVVYTNKKHSIELKEWLAIAMYLQSFPVGSRGLPEVSSEYRKPKARVAVLD